MHVEAILKTARRMVQQLNETRRDGERRYDAGETALLARALLQVLTKEVDIQYPALKARQLIPVSGEIDPGAETYSYPVWDRIGMATIITNYADNLPRVDALMTEVIGRIKSLGDSYAYSLQDLRRAAFAARTSGIARLDTKRQTAAREVIEFSIDDIAAFGNTDAGLTGIANHPSVPLVVPITGNWSVGGATAAQVIADLNAIVQSIIIATKQIETPDTLIFGTTAYAYASQLPFSAFNGPTVLQWFIENNPYINNIDQWVKLDKANAGGTGPRAITYRRSPDVLELQIPQEFEQMPPEQENLSWKVACHARTGGVSVYRPLAMAYVDGL